jgi:hypothetical protein
MKLVKYTYKLAQIPTLKKKKSVGAVILSTTAHF